MENDSLRKRLLIEQIPQWRIATELNICEATVQRWLRVPLSPDKEKLINSAIDAIIEKRGVTA